MNRMGIVPDRRSRIIPEVVLVRRWAVRVLGIWKGEGLGDGWGKEGQFTSNLRPRWKILSQLGGFQVSRRGYKGEEKGNWQGEVKARGMRHV
jgi:hypothetical protein